VIGRLGSPETQVLYCGGAWLDEDVLVAALSAVQIGYDTRVLVDVSVARSQFDQASASDRLAQHGVLIATVRQTVLEWSLAAADDDIGQQLRDTLNLHQ
jgi:nicotinamidase-related amidase